MENNIYCYIWYSTSNILKFHLSYFNPLKKSYKVDLLFFPSFFNCIKKSNCTVYLVNLTNWFFSGPAVWLQYKNWFKLLNHLWILRNEDIWLTNSCWVYYRLHYYSQLFLYVLEADTILPLALWLAIHLVEESISPWHC